MGSFRTAVQSVKIETPVYLSHIAALLVPGRAVQSHTVMSHDLTVAGDLEGWTDEELELLITEGHRALDDQRNRFAQIRATAQIVLPVAVALVVVFGSELREVVHEPTDWVRYMMYAVWLTGTGLVLLSALGAGAVLVVRSAFGSILPTVLSRTSPPIRRDLAKAYAEQVPTGETTCGTRLTVIRDAVMLLVLGALMHLGLWIVQVL